MVPREEECCRLRIIDKRQIITKAWAVMANHSFIKLIPNRML